MPLKPNVCRHLQELTIVAPDEYTCAECSKTGDQWVHLRKCQTCGITLCCDSSPNKHATQHYHQTGHPVMISAEPNEFWAWCYEDEDFYQYQ
jgi:uncharacterized UBP type Zn finger protein